jgi:hypothetical protein
MEVTHFFIIPGLFITLLEVAVEALHFAVFITQGGLRRKVFFASIVAKGRTDL